jgi:prevent-host-death family protein
MTKLIFLLEVMVMSIGTWTVAEAKAKFSELVDKARVSGPQTITKNGHTAAVVVSAEEWERKTRRLGNLAEFFAESPLRGAGLKVDRMKDGPREIDL